MFKVQTHPARTLSWWYKQKNKIDFSPPYQRKGNLWGDRDKAFLIDSILNEYDIPKIYIADFTILNTNLNENNLPYAVIDGRQRLESIFAFYEDRIALNTDFILFSNPELMLGGYTYSQLRMKYPQVSEIFEEFNLDVMSVITDDRTKIKDLFVRLNKSKALTGAELRNAMEGIVPDLIRGLADSYFFKEVVRFSTDRGQDYNAAAKLLLIECKGGFVDTKKKQLDHFVKEGSETNQPEIYYDAAYRSKVVIEKLCEVFEPKDRLLSSHGMLPLYYELVKQDVIPSRLRRFLADFEARRKENQRLSRVNPALADSTLFAFDSAVRSINDQGSLISAFEIINRELFLFGE